MVLSFKFIFYYSELLRTGMHFQKAPTLWTNVPSNFGARFPMVGYFAIHSLCYKTAINQNKNGDIHFIKQNYAF